MGLIGGQLGRVSKRLNTPEPLANLVPTGEH